MMIKQNKIRKSILIPTVIVALALLVSAGFFGLKAYNDYQKNKIYSVGQTMDYPDFNLIVTKAELKPVKLPIKSDLIKEHGDIDKPEDCDTDSKEKKMEWFGTFKFPGVSDYNICIRRNDSRKEINKYSEANRQLVVNYKIIAKDTVNTKGIKIRLIPDSGRNPTKRVDDFNGDEFMMDRYFQYNDAITETSQIFDYVPYFSSEIGENISKGLTRTGYLYTDIRNNEKSTDFILTYSYNGEENTRTVRIDSSKK